MVAQGHSLPIELLLLIIIGIDTETVGRSISIHTSYSCELWVVRIPVFQLFIYLILYVADTNLNGLDFIVYLLTHTLELFTDSANALLSANYHILILFKC